MGWCFAGGQSLQFALNEKMDAWNKKVRFLDMYEIEFPKSLNILKSLVKKNTM